MWAERCGHVCKHVARVALKPIVAAPIMLTGFSAALMAIQTPIPPKPALSCGCRVVWQPRHIYVSDKTWGRLADYAAQVAQLEQSSPAGPREFQSDIILPDAASPVTVSPLVLPSTSGIPSPPGGHVARHDVPEPASVWLLALGAILTGFASRRKILPH